MRNHAFLMLLPFLLVCTFGCETNDSLTEPEAAPISLNASSTGCTDYFTGTTHWSSARTSHGNSFTACMDGVVTGIELAYGDDSPDATGRTLSLFNGNTVSGTAVYTQSGVTVDGGYGFALITLTTPFPVTNGSQYTFEVDAPSPVGYACSLSNGRSAYFDGAESSDCNVGFRVQIAPSSSQSPVADANGPYVADEGTEITLDASGSSDPDGDPLEYRWWSDGSPISNWSATPTLQHTYFDNGSPYVQVDVRDSSGSMDSDNASVTINNVPPTCGTITGLPTAPVLLGTAVSASASFTDPGTADTHTAQWDWDSPNGVTSSGTVTQGAGSGSVDDSHTYTDAGVYTIALTVTDDDGGSCTTIYEFVVVYDPSSGFVTGGGWIYSDPGAYVPDPTLEGKASFGFVSKYKKGATVPTGNTEFQFKAGDLNFRSSSYDFLVITMGGTNAQFKGSGAINGAPAPTGNDYKFMLWAKDDSPDTFRIRIWYENGGEVVVYDNGFDQPIGGGSIVIHTK